MDLFPVVCPYCGEEGEVYVEPDVHGTLVQDCEVCCNPWQVNVWWEDGEPHVDVRRGDCYDRTRTAPEARGDGTQG
jgi:hypothetical protein